MVNIQLRHDQHRLKSESLRSNGAQVPRHHVTDRQRRVQRLRNHTAGHIAVSNNSAQRTVIRNQQRRDYLLTHLPRCRGNAGIRRGGLWVHDHDIAQRGAQHTRGSVVGKLLGRTADLPGLQRVKTLNIGVLSNRVLEICAR